MTCLQSPLRSMINAVPPGSYMEASGFAGEFEGLPERGAHVIITQFTVFVTIFVAQSSPLPTPPRHLVVQRYYVSLARAVLFRCTLKFRPRINNQLELKWSLGSYHNDRNSRDHIGQKIIYFHFGTSAHIPNRIVYIDHVTATVIHPPGIFDIFNTQEQLNYWTEDSKFTI